MNQDQLFCDVCNVGVPSEAVMIEHVKGKKHINNMQQHQRRSKQVGYSVYVRGFPAYYKQSHLTYYFKKFGTVESVFIGGENQYALVKFKDPETVTRVLEKDHHLGNIKLVVKAREMPTTAAATTPAKPKEGVRRSSTGALPEKQSELVDQPTLLTKLRACPSFEEQISTLQVELALTEDDVELRRELAENLQTFFNEHDAFKGAKVHQFGSSVNGLGCKGCDMDLFLDLDAASRGHTVSIEDIAQLLRTEKLGLSKVCAIPARCLLVKFVHETSGLKCDLTFNNRLALRNTQLIQIFSEFDSRVKAFIFALRYWAKVRELAVNMSSGPRLTNYSLTLIALFYLQNLDEPILPSVEVVANLADSDEEGEVTTIDGWDCSFTTDMTRVPASNNRTTLQELLQGFFQFFANFDFVGKAICPRSGRTADITEFLDSRNTLGAIEPFKAGSVNIQDPFVLGHNTSHNVGRRVMHLMVHEVRNALAKFEQPDFAEASPETDWGLSLLFSSTLLVPPMPDGQWLGELDYRLHIDYNPGHFPQSFVSQCPTTNHMKKRWVLRLTNFLLSITKDLLLFDFKVSHDKRAAIQRSLDGGEWLMESDEEREEFAVIPVAEEESNVEKDAVTPMETAAVTPMETAAPAGEETLTLETAEDTTNRKRPIDDSDAGIGENGGEVKRARGEENDGEQESKEGGNDVESQASGVNDLDPVIDTVVLHAHCKTKLRMWHARKHAVPYLAFPTKLYGMELEKAITEYKIKHDSLAKKKPPRKGFEFILAVVVENLNTDGPLQYEIQMQPPVVGEKEFPNFYQFFRGYIDKLAHKCLFSRDDE